ncbi:hypothetical protein PFISCL1PPCAC_21016, partial [Pristionchus fissidentatus]
ESEKVPTTRFEKMYKMAGSINACITLVLFAFLPFVATINSQAFFVADVLFIFNLVYSWIVTITKTEWKIPCPLLDTLIYFVLLIASMGLCGWCIASSADPDSVALIASYAASAIQLLLLALSPYAIRECRESQNKPQPTQKVQQLQQTTDDKPMQQATSSSQQMKEQEIVPRNASTM